MKRLILLVSILTCLLPRGAIAKEEQKPALKLDDLLVKEDELPAGGSVVSGMHCVSTQPVTIFSMPAAAINTGQVDRVLGPDRIRDMLIKLAGRLIEV